MSKIRNIDPCIRLSESVAQLTYRQRDLWTRLLLTVDDQGRFPANPLLIRANVWALDNIDIKEVEEELKTLEGLEFILIYEVDGKRFLQIRKWQKYQRASEWLGQSEYPAPKGWQDRFRFHGKERKIIQSDNWSNSDSLLLPNNLNTPSSPLPNELIAENNSLPCEDVKEDVEIKVKNKDKGNEEIKVLPEKPLLLHPSNDEIKIWNMVVGDLQSSGLSKADYDSYFKDLELIGEKNGLFTLKAINKFIAKLILARYGELLNQRLNGFLGSPTSINIIV